MPCHRRAYSPRQHLRLLLVGLEKLEAKLEAGEHFELEFEHEDLPEPAPKSQIDEVSSLLRVEGGYVPGKYRLADKLVQDLDLEHDEDSK